MNESISEYERERRAKLQKLRELGVDPFGGRVEGVEALSALKLKVTPEMGHESDIDAIGAGRIVLKRDMGKLSFITLRDGSGEDLQVALDRRRLDAVDPKFWEVRNLLDLGDQIVVSGKLGKTNKGEPTIWATSVAMASKALLPPPAKWEGLSDVEQRYRQRYVDLFSNPEVMRMMKLRSQIIEEIRAFLRDRGYTEVETPMMQILHGGAAAKPFETHHNALDTKLYLRIAPELYLKRLLVGGFTKVFELNRNFRNEGISPRHNPEFTMLEAYEAFGSWETMAEMVESLICHVAERVFGTLRIKHPNGREINLEGDLSKPAGQRWRRATMADLFKGVVGSPFNCEGISLDQIERAAEIYGEKLGESIPLANRSADYDALVRTPIYESQTRFASHLDSLKPAEQLQEIYEKLVEPTLVDPCFVTQVPGVIIPLARRNKEDNFFADVYELAINGVEISPGYSELNDPDVQIENFSHQVGDKEEQQKVDNDFVDALKYGMPPAGGMGLGVDRLIMMLTGADSIRDVILFPLMRKTDE